MLLPTTRALDVLAEREAARLEYSTLPRASMMSDPVSLLRRLPPERLFYSVANSMKHRVDNRYSNIYAYDRTAVSIGNAQYLNANVVCDELGSWWVASQAPLPRTMYYYFRAMFDRSASSHPALLRKPPGPPPNRAVIVVQLTGLREGGMIKADPYVPDIGKQNIFASSNSDASISLRVDEVKPLADMGSVYTTASLSAGVEPPMSVHHYLFEGWPDHGVPTGHGLTHLRALIERIGSERERLGGVDECEVWVHCSAGVGRTGTFIALSSLLLSPPITAKKPIAKPPSSPLGPLPEDLQHDAVAKTIDGLREWRGYLCQTNEQVGLVYQLSNL